MDRVIRLWSAGGQYNADGIMKPCTEYWVMIHTPELHKAQFIGTARTPEELYKMTFQAIGKYCDPERDKYKIINEIETIEDL